MNPTQKEEMRKRCEKLANQMEECLDVPFGNETIDVIEAFAREIRNDALEEIKRLRSCQNESWECEKEIRTLKLDREMLRAACASMGRLLQSGVVVPNDEYSKLRRVINACRKNTHKSQEIADAIREYGEADSIREEIKK